MSSDQFLHLGLGSDDDEDGRLFQTKKRKCNQEEEQGGTNWLDLLPQDVALDIISRLPIKSLIQSRFVCKFCQKLSYDPHLVSLHLSKELNCDNPYVILHCDVPIKNQLYFVEFFNHDDCTKQKQEKVGKIDPPFSALVPEFNVIGSCNGILCLENSLFEEALYLYNPFTRDYKELPKPTIYQDQMVVYGFGFHPNTNQYKLIKIVYYSKKHNVNEMAPYRLYMVNGNLLSDVQIFSLGSNRWRSIGRIPYRLQRRSNAVLLNGRLHWTTDSGIYNGRKDRQIVSFDISDEVFREVPGPELMHRMSRRNYQLAVLGDCLCAAVPVAASCGTLDIWIMREYNRKESWMKEIKIEGQTVNFRTQELRRSYGIWRNALTVICLLKNGEVLLEHITGILVAYNPETGIFRDITFPGVPKPSKTIVHVGSLNRVDYPSQILRLA